MSSKTVFFRRYSTTCAATALALAVLAIPAMRLSAQEPLVLHDGTPLRLRLTRNLSSAEANTGDRVDFEVLEDVKVGDVTIVARGATALGTVTEAQAKRRMGRGGKLDVSIESVRLVDGEKAPLRAIKEGSGKGHVGAMTGAMVATSLVAWPAAPFFLLMHGKDMTIRSGTEITAFTQGDITLDPAKFQPKPVLSATAQPAVMRTAPAAARAITNADILMLRSAGFADDLLIAKIKSAPGDYRLDTSDIIELKKSQVSEAVIQAMLDAQSRGR